MLSAAPRVITKFGEYLDSFARFKNSENLHALSSLLDSHTELKSVERALLGSLCCDSSDEAKSLVPTLANKFSDAELQDMLNQMQILRGSNCKRVRRHC